MALTHDEVKKVAKLARITLTEAEVEKFAVQLENILTYINVLNEVDTTGVPVMAQVCGLHDIDRPDRVEPWVAREELLAVSPLPVEQNQVTVPSVFEDQ